MFIHWCIYYWLLPMSMVRRVCQMMLCVGPSRRHRNVLPAHLIIIQVLDLPCLCLCLSLPLPPSFSSIYLIPFASVHAFFPPGIVVAILSMLPYIGKFPHSQETSACPSATKWDFGVSRDRRRVIALYYVFGSRRFTRCSGDARGSFSRFRRAPRAHVRARCNGRGGKIPW